MSAPAHALILTAGLGTRLQPLTSLRAKPAIPVAGEPLVRRIIRSLVAEGVRNITLNLHHRPETLAAVVGDGSDLGARVRYSWELPQILGSAGGPRQALDIIGADAFLLVNGDTLADVDVRALWRAHMASDALVTLALVPNAEPLRYGGVRLADDGAYARPEPRGPAAVGSFHFVGVQAVRRGAFLDIPHGAAAASIGGVYERLAAERPGAVRGFVTGARFWDIGTVADYLRTNAALADSSAPVHTSGTSVSGSASVTRSRSTPKPLSAVWLRKSGSAPASSAAPS